MYKFWQQIYVKFDKSIFDDYMTLTLGQSYRLATILKSSNLI